MIQLLVVVLGAVVGFGGSRLLRRPARTAGAASVARSVGGAVGSRRDLDLPHLQRSVLSEMMRHVVTKGGTTTVPATYRVRLHPDDHQTVQQAPGFFRQGLEQAMAAAGTDNGWTVPAKLTIELSADPSRSRGAPAVDVDPPAPAAAPAPAPAAAPAPAPAPTPTAGPRLERSDGGPTHLITSATVGIGRSSDRAIRIDDDRVSRQHATVARSGAGYTVTDDGSSNGTRVNDHVITPMSPIPLADGDRIGIGPVDLVFRSGSPS